MSRGPPIFVSCIALLIIGCGQKSQVDAFTDSNQAKYADFPDGFDYPAAEEIEKALHDQNRERLESHARQLWNGINTQREGQPWWRAWETAGTLYKPTCSSLKEKRGQLGGDRIPGPKYNVIAVIAEKYPDFDFGKVCDGPTHQNNGDILIVDVSYNPAAADWVRENSLNDSHVLDELRANDVKAINPFPAESIVTKHMYWPVKYGPVPTAVPVWVPPDKPDDPITYRGYETWDEVVAVSRSPKEDFATVAYLFGVTEIPNRTDKLTRGPIKKIAPTMPLEAFVHHQVSKEEYDALDARDKMLLDLSASWAYGGTFGPGDYLVSVAMHINTREIPGWTFQSIWWEPPTKQDGEAYQLVQSDGLREADGKVRDAFNPFIELAARHPILTDCRNCHIRAGWQIKKRTEDPQPSYKYPHNYGRLDWIPPDSEEFSNITMLDFQWSTKDRASIDPP